jgi:hypothetical protein
MEQRMYMIALEEKAHMQKQNKIFSIILQDSQVAKVNQLGKISGSP